MLSPPTLMMILAPIVPVAVVLIVYYDAPYRRLTDILALVSLIGALIFFAVQ